MAHKGPTRVRARVPHVTSAEIARRLGISRSTVSRAFTPGAAVNPETRARVMRMAKSLGYQPNVFAKALISRQSPIVGVVMGDLSNPFHAEIHSALTQQMQAAGLTPLTTQLVGSDGVDRALAIFSQYQVRQVILTSFAITEDVLEACLASELEVVLLNRVDLDGRTPAICADLAQGGRLAAGHLAARGYRRVAIVEGMAGTWTSRSRVEGYLQGIEAHDLTMTTRLPGDYSYRCGLAAAGRLLDRAPLPEAVLCANDLTAFGMIDGLRRTGGLRIPGDIAVIGFDDVPMAGWKAYDLTTIRLPVMAMVARLTELLDRMRHEPESGVEVTFLPCRLVARETA